MPQRQVELILMRQLASYLTMPVFVAGEDEKLLYYNQAAEALLGRPFDEVGAMSLDEIAGLFKITDGRGKPVPPDAIPLGVALRERRPSHRALSYRGLNGVERSVEVTAFPLSGLGGRHLGAVAFFWEAGP